MTDIQRCLRNAQYSIIHLKVLINKVQDFWPDVPLLEEDSIQGADKYSKVHYPLAYPPIQKVLGPFETHRFACAPGQTNNADAYHPGVVEGDTACSITVVLKTIRVVLRSVSVPSRIAFFTIRLKFICKEAITYVYRFVLREFFVYIQCIFTLAAQKICC